MSVINPVHDMTDLDMFEQLLSCCTIDELYTSMARIIRQMEFEHFVYLVRVHTLLTRPYQFILSGYPKEWRSHYNQAGYENIDPVVDHCIRKRRIIPLIWDKNLGDNRAALMWGEAAEFGLVSGVSFPMHGCNSESALLSLATSQNPQ
jgi:hypothetical protein